MLFVECNNLQVGPRARQLDRVGSDACAEIHDPAAGRRRQHSEDLIGRQVAEARGVVEQRRSGGVEALGLTGAMPIGIAVAMPIVLVRVVLFFHEEFSVQADFRKAISRPMQ